MALNTTENQAKLAEKIATEMDFDDLFDFAVGKMMEDFEMNRDAFDEAWEERMSDLGPNGDLG